jgi:hypothetical protein
MVALNLLPVLVAFATVAIHPVFTVRPDLSLREGFDHPQARRSLRARMLQSRSTAWTLLVKTELWSC